MPSFVNILLLAILCVQVNALPNDRAHVARFAHAHNAIAKHKRSPDPSCIPKPSTSLTPTSTPTPTWSPTPTTSPTSTWSPTSTPVPSTSASATPTSTPSSSSKKWGLAYAADPSYLGSFALSGVGYIYNWNPAVPSPPAGIVAMPMLWGYDQVQEFTSSVSTSNPPQIILGMNEPNEPSQSNMSPQDAFNMWMQYINPFAAHGTSLYSPACTDDDSGLAWYQEFMSLCTATSGCTVDVLAFHAYTTDAQSVIDYATTLHNTYNMDIAITEFADQNYSGTGGQATMDELWNYAGMIKEFVESTDWLVMACPFAVETTEQLQGNNVNTVNSLMDDSGNPTALAEFYFN